MRIQISTTEAARNLGDCLARIKHTGDHYILTKNRRPVAELGPVAGNRGASLQDLWEAMRQVEVDRDFASDLADVNEADEIQQNPWP